ncbi:MAG: 16S rRNA (uracil(1498)-N(3))-methyltransferase [Gammaproteobacteria bacterium]
MSRVPRVYVADGIPGPGELVLEEAAATHLAQVLRARPGDEVVLFDGRGGEYPATVVETGRRRLRLEAGPRQAVEREPPLPVVLLQGLCRGERMDLVVRKATELGASAILPVVTERTVVKLDARRLQNRLTHWRAIVVSACEQCGRNRLPEVLEPEPAATAVEQFPAALKLMLDPTGTASLQTLPSPDPAGGVALLVGPEGGLTDAERARAREAGYAGLRLGPRVLRTETAAITGVAVLQARFGDLGGPAG